MPRLRPARRSAAAIRALVSRAACAGVGTKASNELRAIVREYYPAFLDTFAGKSATNLAKPEARAILAIAGRQLGGNAKENKIHSSCAR